MFIKYVFNVYIKLFWYLVYKKIYLYFFIEINISFEEYYL